MKNYYDILGVNEQSTSADITKAFKDLAKQHHPDRGGTQEKFQEINEAHDTLKSSQKRHDYDTQRKFGGSSQGSGHNFNFNMNDLFEEDVFNNVFSNSDMDFGGRFNFRRGTHPFTQRQQANKSINVKISISLKDIITATEKTLSIKLPSGRDEIISVKIPAGCMNNSIFKYKGLGDDTHKNIPRGHLIVQVTVLDCDGFARKQNDIYTEKTISCFEAVRGTTFQIKTLDDKILNVNVPAGTQPNSFIQLKGQGVPMPDAINIRGSILVKISILIPQLNKKDLQKIKDL